MSMTILTMTLLCQATSDWIGSTASQSCQYDAIVSISKMVEGCTLAVDNPRHIQRFPTLAILFAWCFEHNIFVCRGCCCRLARVQITCGSRPNAYTSQLVSCVSGSICCCGRPHISSWSLKVVRMYYGPTVCCHKSPMNWNLLCCDLCPTNPADTCLIQTLRNPWQR